MPSAQVPALDAWVVVALWQGGHWKVFPNLWLSRERAEQVAAGLTPGYTQRHLLHVHIGASE